jgi:hypothetical protein
MRSFRLLAAAAVLALGLVHCELLEETGQQIKQQFNILAVQFGFKGIGLEPIPKDVSGLATALLDFTNWANLRSQTGVTVICTTTAKNPNDDLAMFKGALFHLLINDVSNMSGAVTATIDSFAVEGKDSIEIPIPFPIHLDNSAFSKDVWQKIVGGDDIPYKLKADLVFDLLPVGFTSGMDALGRDTVSLDLVNSSAPTRLSSDAQNALLGAINVLLQ